MENKDNEFIKDWMEGNISPEEMKSRKEKDDALVREFDELITRSAHLKVPSKTSKDDAWKKLEGKLTDAQKPEAKVVRMNRWIPVSIAASLTLIVAVAFFIFSETTVGTQFAEKKVHILPDGSEVTLNAGSVITFRKIGWSENRTIALQGEAFFEVKKGSSFKVVTENGTVAVLGTSFNVRSRGSAYEVSCYTGTVKVVSGPSEVTLTKGQFTTLESVLSTARSFDSTKTTWRNGDFYFEKQPLRVVFDELERQFNVEILFSGDASRLYSGYFSNKNLEQALDMVTKPMALQYRRAHNEITIN